MLLKDISVQPDAAQFVQVQRSVVVNLRSIHHVSSGAGETGDIHLKA